MSDLLWLGLFMLAVASGWWLGRRERRPLERRRAAQAISDNHLLGQPSDATLKRLSEVLEVSNDTFDAHLAVGRQFRQRGDLERATQVHQNLLARPELGRAEQERAQLELARDFLAAGVFSRAERLLQELVEVRAGVSGEALLDLQRIYERERDWARAVEIARQLPPGEPSPQVALGHYYCEWAEQSLRRGEAAEARALLERALESDPACARASLLLARLHAAQGEERAAIGRLLQVAEQDRDFLAESLEPLLQHAASTGSLAQLEAYLRAQLARDEPTVRDALALSLARVVGEREGDAAAQALLREQLARHPSLALIRRLLECAPADAGALADSAVRDALARLAEEVPAWRCRRCGFQARRLHWQCPACHGWAVVRPRQVGPAH